MGQTRRRRRGVIAVVLIGAFVIVVVVGGYLYLHRNTGPEQLGDRAMFTSDACLEYAPTGKDRHLTVFLDPGHGGPDPGASGTAPDGTHLQEKALTLTVALDMLPRLRHDGFHVTLSRVTDTAVARIGPGDLNGSTYSVQGEHSDIEARIDCANDARAQLLLSVHFDAYGSPSVGGAETTYDPARPFSAKSERFAGLVQSAIIGGFARQGWTLPNRGVISDASVGTPTLTQQAAAYGHLLELGPAQAGWLARPSTMPGALVEPLFLTDPGEAAVIEGTHGQKVLAASLCSAIDKYFAGR
jgi:N-acetylmuramoyl-L-alanine amidase